MFFTNLPIALQLIFLISDLTCETNIQGSQLGNQVFGLDIYRYNSGTGGP